MRLEIWAKFGFIAGGKFAKFWQAGQKSQKSKGLNFTKFYSDDMGFAQSKFKALAQPLSGQISEPNLVKFGYTWEQILNLKARS